MKSNELRIGNYVLDKNDEIKKNHGVNDVVGIAYVNFENEFDKLINSEISPIPLTNEWFSKLGMSYYSLPTRSGRKIGYYTLKYGNRFKINSSDGSYSFINFRKEIIYVHQLQNLYFALTGEELILNK